MLAWIAQLLLVLVMHITNNNKVRQVNCDRPVQAETERSTLRANATEFKPFSVILREHIELDRWLREYPWPGYMDGGTQDDEAWGTIRQQWDLSSSGPGQARNEVGTQYAEEDSTQNDEHAIVSSNEVSPHNDDHKQRDERKNK